MKRDSEDSNMAYQLSPSQDGGLLFFRMDGESAERHGVIGYFRADFGADGYGFFFKWFDSQPHLKTPNFRRELDSVINYLRVDGQETPFTNRMVLERFCSVNPGKDMSVRGSGYMIRTEDFSYYFRCLPLPGDHDIYCFAYDNRYLLPELAGQHRLPIYCFSVLPSNGELVMIVSGKYGYFPSSNSTPFHDVNRKTADEFNSNSGVTRAQEEAMLAGSLFGWKVPAAKPWSYNHDGSPRPLPPKPKDREVR